ncbi:hypothetical protein BDN70DRAFT_90500 [Pholiota conissans]|uniref:Uncharacterized protein n=1 Tax=Pholiota conissans TaxID=109636 RepID=A0A9P6CYT6_9AGAR|nr:hypothetical protein BDN70DRAFT_90500 [Pholiota conissans]
MRSRHSAEGRRTTSAMTGASASTLACSTLAGKSETLRFLNECLEILIKPATHRLPLSKQRWKAAKYSGLSFPPSPPLREVRDRTRPLTESVNGSNWRNKRCRVVAFIEHIALLMGSRTGAGVCASECASGLVEICTSCSYFTDPLKHSLRTSNFHFSSPLVILRHLIAA